MNCSGCGQANDAGMQFCIFCGQSLAEIGKSEGASSTSSASSTSAAAVASQPDPLLCSVCGKSDTLNGQFCVFCGGRTTSAKNQRLVQPLQASPKPSLSAKEMPEALLLGLALCVGALFGLALIHLAEPMLASSARQKLWSDHKFLLYTDAPFANLELANKDERTFFFGMTGASGALIIDSLQPGTYTMKVKGRGNEHQEDIQIKEGQPTVLGYPEFLKL